MNEKASILKQITAWFEKLSALPKQVISVVAIVTTFSGYMAIHDNKVIRKYEKVNEQQQIRNQLNTVIQFQLRDSIFNINAGKKVDSLIISFRGGMQSIDAMKRSNEKLKTYMMDNAATKQDLREVIKIWDEKKN